MQLSREWNRGGIEIDNRVVLLVVVRFGSAFQTRRVTSDASRIVKERSPPRETAESSGATRVKGCLPRLSR